MSQLSNLCMCIFSVTFTEYPLSLCEHVSIKHFFAAESRFLNRLETHCPQRDLTEMKFYKVLTVRHIFTSHLCTEKENGFKKHEMTCLEIFVVTPHHS